MFWRIKFVLAIFVESNQVIIYNLLFWFLTTSFRGKIFKVFVTATSQPPPPHPPGGHVFDVAIIVDGHPRAFLY